MKILCKAVSLWFLLLSCQYLRLSDQVLVKCCKFPMVAAMRSSNGCVSPSPNKCGWGCSLQSFCMREVVCMEKDTSCW